MGSTMFIFLPLEFSIRLLGLRFTLICFITLILALINFVPFHRGIESAIFSAVIIYYFFGLFRIFSRQKHLFNSLIYNLDPVSFDYRNLKLDTLLSKDTTVALLYSFRELSRINQQQKNQLNTLNHSSNQIIKNTTTLSNNV